MKLIFTHQWQREITDDIICCKIPHQLPQKLKIEPSRTIDYRKLLMRLSIFTLLLISALDFSLAHSAEGQRIENIRLNVTFHNATLKTVFKKLEKDTDLLFAYPTASSMHVKVNLSPQERSVKDILDLVLEDTPLAYKQLDNNVLIFSKVPEESFTNAINPVAGPLKLLKEITGQVIDALTGDPLPGVNILIKGTTQGTITGSQGKYTINASEGNLLVFSFIGYKTQEIRIGAQSTIEVFLEENIEALNEVVINAGYYETTQKESTGNIVRVTAKDIENQPLTSPLEALQGRMAGVEITQLSGQPGAAPSIWIRGRNSIRYDANDPLYIIDGVPIDASPISAGGFLLRIGADPLSTLNLSNIESIEILKDADATAIYGSRGANGVILITTKKGKAGKATVEINAYTGAGKVPYFMDLLNTQQYLAMRREAFANSGVTPTEANAVDLMIWDTTRYTDWQKELIGGTANLSNVQASISGGSMNTNFRAGGSFQKQGTVFPGDFYYQKMTGFFNLNHISNNSKLKTSLSVSYGNDNNNLFLGGGSEMSNAAFLPPNAPALYKENGDLNWADGTWNNPAAAMRQSQKVSTNTINLNSQINYNLFSGLNLKTSLGYTRLNAKGTIKMPANTTNPAYGQESSSTLRSNARDSWIIEPQLTYNLNVGNGTLDMLVGSTFQESTTERLLLTGTGFVDKNTMENMGTADNVIVSPSLTGQSEYRYTAIFGRLAYNWRSKYFLNLTGRRDGSTRFGPGKRFANLGAVGAAWIFTEEPVMKENLPFISFGKLRTSYGITGSDQIGDYGYLETWSATNGAGGLYPTRLANPDYSWETNQKFEAALELGFFNDRFLVSSSWYRNRSSNQLVGYPLAYTTGFTSVQANLGATVENRGWEFELNTTNIKTNEFQWKTSANISFPKNKLIEFPNLEQTSYANNYVVGEPLSIQFQYQYTGLDPETGLYTVLDVNEDGRYNTDDQVVYTNVAREYYGGVNNSFSYKNFRLDFLIELVHQTAGAGARFLNSSYAPGALGASNGNIQGNVLTEMLGRWQQEGDNTDIQKFVQGGGDTRYYGYAASSAAAYDNDASFIRLKTLSFSYSLSESLISRAGLSGCKLYVQGQNLFTMTEYLGWDAQSPYTGALPALRMVTGGIQLRF